MNVCAFAVLVALAGSGRAQDATPPADAAERAVVRTILERARAESGFPGAVAGVRAPDGGTFAVACGVSDAEKGTPMRESDLLHAGSVGKMFFAALALQLVAESKLELDALIGEYVSHEDWFADLPNGDAITVRMLIAHTSGLPTYGSAFMTELANDPGRERDPLDGIRSARGQSPQCAPGERHAYSDINYLVLAALCERVTKKSAYDEIRRRVLQPLALERVVPADRATIAGLVPGYAGAENPFGGDLMVKDGALVLHPRFESGGGGFVTNAEDLARFVVAFCEGRAFDSKLLAEALRGVEAPDSGPGSRYGLGIHIDKTPLGTAYGHSGYFPGYVTWVRWYPERRVAVALQFNTSDDARLPKSPREIVDEIASAMSSRAR